MCFFHRVLWTPQITWVATIIQNGGHWTFAFTATRLGLWLPLWVFSFPPNPNHFIQSRPPLLWRSASRSARTRGGMQAPWFNPTGKSLNVLSIPFCENICVPLQSKSLHKLRRPVPLRGVSRSSRTRGGMHWTRRRALTNGAGCGRWSRVVLTPRRWRQVGR